MPFEHKRENANGGRDCGISPLYIRYYNINERILREIVGTSNALLTKTISIGTVKGHWHHQCNV
jgi:hypothetical protein